MQDLGELLQDYKHKSIELVALKEELLRQGFIPPTLVLDTEAFIGTVDVDTQGAFPRLVAESKARHAASKD